METALRLKDIQKEILTHYAEPSGYDQGFHLATWDNRTWNAVFRRLVEPQKTLLAAQRSRWLPVLLLPEKELAAMLLDDAPEVRIRAIRSLQRTSDQTILKKLVGCMYDPYHEPRVGLFESFTGGVYHVIEEAETAIVVQGPNIVPLLVAAADREDTDIHRLVYRQRVIPILGKIGPSADAERFLANCLQSQDENERLLAIHAFGAWGPPALTHLLKVAQDDKENESLRGFALVHIPVTERLKLGHL